MNKYAIGDIHGRLDKLTELLDIIKPESDDLLIFLGDYIDRGKDSKKVVDRLIKLSSETNCIFLKGNHEDMLLYYYLERHDPYLFLSNGGNLTLESYGITPFDKNEKELISEEHMKFFNNLKLIDEDDDYIFVHAGLNPFNKSKEQSEFDLLWIRSIFINNSCEFITKKKVIFGHTPKEDYTPWIMKDKIGIDTGCVFGGPLTAIKLPEEKIISTVHDS